uniref:5-hydroxytryptamine (serotonin) receptor 3A n=1 Tax=Myripristis murdjan TaxID=586833 RepID=A0A667ZCA0_9TELE
MNGACVDVEMLLPLMVLHLNLSPKLCQLPCPQICQKKTLLHGEKMQIKSINVGLYLQAYYQENRQSDVWQNEFVSWDPIQCGTDKISLPRKKFWVPDAVINEFMYQNTAPDVPYVHLYHNGYMHDALPVRVVSSCHLNIYTFPFDIQNCTLTFNSYTHTGEALHRFNVQESVTKLKIRRRATLYVMNLILPSCFLITVDLFSFLLPPQSVDRSSFKMTLILGYTVFLLIMNDLLPITGNTIPLINVFFSLCLALMVASLLETILITNLLCGSANFSPPPYWVQVLVLRVLGCLVGLPPKPREQKEAVTLSPVVAEDSKAVEEVPQEKGSVVEDKVLKELRRLGQHLEAIRLQVDSHVSGGHGSEEWIQVGFIIDRLLFGLYILFISLSFIAIIIIWVNSYSK